MIRAALLSVLGLVVGMASPAAQAQYIYSPVGYYSSPVVHSVYSAPIPVGVSYYAPAPMLVARPIYTPVVRTYYTPRVVSYVAPIQTVSYSSYGPTPIAIDPVYVAPAPVYFTPAPVVVSRAIYSPVVHESVSVRPFSSTYRATTGWGGPSVYARSGPFRTVVRTRGW